MESESHGFLASCVHPSFMLFQSTKSRVGLVLPAVIATAKIIVL